MFPSEMSAEDKDEISRTRVWAHGFQLSLEHSSIAVWLDPFVFAGTGISAG